MKSVVRWHCARAFLLACALASFAAQPVAAFDRDRGSGALLSRIDSIVNRAIRNGATPGAALAIGHGDDEPEFRTYGRIDWSPGSAAVTENTLYDLASVTKVLATTPAAMLLVQQGRLDLDRTVASYLEWWPQDGAKGRITVRQLLLHNSGLPAGNKLWRVSGDREARIRHIAASPLLAKPGAVTVYSDLGMILLGAIVETVSGERLDQFVDGHLFRPLALADTRYLPLRPESGSPVPLDRIAPTEWAGRRGHLQGDVDDANAWALDGVAGHAGLFSSVRDVAHFARLILKATEGEQTDVLDASVIRSFAADRPDGRRALGWDGAGSSSWGRYFSPLSFGHNGYTGTSVWIDPERDLYVVLLTNRVNPSASNEKHLALRREVSEAVRAESPIRMAVVNSDIGQASMFAAELAAARTIFTAPVESLRRAAADLGRHGVKRAHGSRHEATRRDRHGKVRPSVASRGGRSHRETLSRRTTHRRPAVHGSASRRSSSARGRRR